MGGGMEKKRKRQFKKREIGFLHNILLWLGKWDGKQKRTAAVGLGMIAVLVAAVFWAKSLGREDAPVMSEAVVAATAPPVQEETRPPNPTPKQEKGIYSYLQGPKSWGKRLKWSGEWGVSYYDGGSFGGFGCGLCCIANIYSSLTEYKCTPVDAYKYAKKHTGYSGGGAIDWGYMRKSLSTMGFDCKVYRKPESYEKFQRQIGKSQAAIVLVSSGDSTCYWKDTPGHYVTVFLYDEKSDKVFLTDSGDPKHNRHWVSLKKIYASLKTASPWQFLSVRGYEEKSDQWKHKNAKGNWVRK